MFVNDSLSEQINLEKESTFFKLHLMYQKIPLFMINFICFLKGNLVNNI